MTKSEILSIINPKNARLYYLLYDKYLITLIDDSQVVGSFDINSVIYSKDGNIWDIHIITNPINHRFEDQKKITLKGENISRIKRLN